MNTAAALPTIVNGVLRCVRTSASATAGGCCWSCHGGTTVSTRLIGSFGLGVHWDPRFGPLDGVVVLGNGGARPSFSRTIPPCWSALAVVPYLPKLLAAG